jgi:transcriptional regulator with XRE-family HTH domain
VDVVRVGRVIRAIRMRRGWRQLDLANRAKVSQSLIARIERGGAGRLRLDTIDRIAAALDARLVVRVDWQGEGADRLLDLDHANVVEELLAFLGSAGWVALPEVTFNDYGERGSIDILAWHEATATLLVIEVKTVVPDIQGMLATFDRKLRHADAVARARGWRPGRIWSVLAISETRTSRRRVEAHSETFDARFPDRARAVRQALYRPETVASGSPPVRGLWFLSSRTAAGSRQRVVRRRQAG